MVPEGWGNAKVQDYGDVNAGRQRSPKFSQGMPRPYLRVANVFDGNINTSNVLKMPFTDDEFERYRLADGDILLNEGQSLELVGRPAMYVGTPTECCFQNTLVRFRPTDRVDPNFALQRFRLCLYDGTFQSIATRTTSIAHLGVSRFANLRLNWPPLSEQKAIAEILSAWDQAIETAEKLIENSKAQKKALMQQLLTGKQRYSQFIDSDEKRQTNYGDLPLDWLFLPISDIAFEQNERAGKNSELPVLSCSKHDGFVDSLRYFKKKVYSDDTSNYKVVRRGCYGFPSNHIEEGSIGYQDICNAGIVSPIYSVFETSERVHDGYLFRLLKTEHYRQIFQARTNASVDRRGSLRWKEFCKILVPLPSFAEQESICKIIDTADHELANLNAQLVLFQSEKRSLMQQLLTGKRRVKVAA